MTSDATSRRPALSGRAVAGAYLAGWAGLRLLPERLASAAFQVGADIAWRRGGPGVRRLEANLARVAGPLPPDGLALLCRDAVRSYARYWLEVFRLPDLPRSRVVGQMLVADERRLREAYAEGRGVILALPHTGNWDHAGAWAVLTGMPFTTVAERLEPARVFDRFVAFRESLGMEVLPLTAGRPVFDVLAERLRAGRMLCLLADRDLTAAGVEVAFFGAPATMPAGPALLALRTGAVLLPVTPHYPPDGARGWRARIHPAVVVPGTGSETEQVQAMTQQLADAFARGIAAHPADWHMLQRLWRDDLVPARRPARRTA